MVVGVRGGTSIGRMCEVRENKVAPAAPRKARGRQGGSPERPPVTLRRSSLISFEGDDENSRVEVSTSGFRSKQSVWRLCDVRGQSRGEYEWF